MGGRVNLRLGVFVVAVMLIASNADAGRWFRVFLDGVDNVGLKVVRTIEGVCSKQTIRAGFLFGRHGDTISRIFARLPNEGLNYGILLRKGPHQIELRLVPDITQAINPADAADATKIQTLLEVTISEGNKATDPAAYFRFVATPADPLATNVVKLDETNENAVATVAEILSRMRPCKPTDYAAELIESPLTTRRTADLLGSAISTRQIDAIFDHIRSATAKVCEPKGPDGLSPPGLD